MFIFAVAQIMLAFAPLAEARYGDDARAHVEEAGTTLHHAHNEADCVACIARGLLSTAHPAAHDVPALASRVTSLVPTASAALESVWSALARSRAPPAVSA